MEVSFQKKMSYNQVGENIITFVVSINGFFVRELTPEEFQRDWSRISEIIYEEEAK